MVSSFIIFATTLIIVTIIVMDGRRIGSIHVLFIGSIDHELPTDNVLLFLMLLIATDSCLACITFTLVVVVTFTMINLSRDDA